MALETKPQAADNIIRFDGTPGGAAVLRYDVEAPGQYRGRRIVELQLGLADDSIRKEATELTRDVVQLAWTQTGDRWVYATGPARDLWFKRTLDQIGGGIIYLSAVANLLISDLLAIMRSIALSKPDTADRQLGALDAHELVDKLRETTKVDIGPDLATAIESIAATYNEYIDGLRKGILCLIAYDAPTGGAIVQQLAASEVLSTAPTDGHFFLVEVYGITSFLGDYGLGKTVRTFTLLPGEETSITMKSWRTDTSKVAQATSIVDSYDSKSASRFNNTVQTETTDKATRTNKLAWHVEAEVGASWGWGSAKISGGVAGENQAAREQFCKGVTNSVKEHTAEAASNRTNSVSLSTETTTTVGTEDTTQRTIRNINLRRVLNFVFRQLNQEYRTVVHLIDIRLGFATSTPNSYREIPISELRSFLEEVLVGDAVDGVASQILRLVGTVMSSDGAPVRTLEKLVLSPDGSYQAAEMDDFDEVPAPPGDRSFIYRWRRGALGQEALEGPKVAGVVMGEAKVVMPTADLVVEALMGQADALDEYAMASQASDSARRVQEIRRISVALDTLEAIADPSERANAWSKVFPAPNGDCCCASKSAPQAAS